MRLSRPSGELFRSHCGRALAVVGALAGAACGPADAGQVWGDVAGDAASADAGHDPVTSIEPGCRAPADVSASPASVEDVVTLVNALQAQRGDAVTLPCFLQSLNRPMGALATRSVFSAQPASGPKNPRFFLFLDNLVMSVVPIGDGRPLLELAAYLSETRSIKAEIHFPVEAPLALRAPYDRVLYGESTTCGACHADQQIIEDGSSDVKRYVSDVLRPRTSEIVNLDFVREQADTCPPDVDPERCAILSALFAHGELTTATFSPMARTIYGGF